MKRPWVHILQFLKNSNLRGLIYHHQRTLKRPIFEVGSRNVLSNSDLHTKTKVSAFQDDIFEGRFY